MCGGTIAVSQGSQMVLFWQWVGTSDVKAERKLEFWSSGTPYQILLAPVWRYSIQGRPCGSRYQQQALNSIPTWSVGMVMPMTGPSERRIELLLLVRTFRFHGCLAQEEPFTLGAGNPNPYALESIEPEWTQTWLSRTATWRQYSLSISATVGSEFLNHRAIVLRAIRKN